MIRSCGPGRSGAAARPPRAGGDTQSAAALKEIITQIRAKNWEVIPIDQMAAKKAELKARPK